MNKNLSGESASREGCDSTSELLVKKTRLETVWIEKIKSTSEPYPLSLGIFYRELRDVIGRLLFTLYGVENGEELELTLWMLLHHRIIKRFRKRIMKAQSILEVKNSSSLALNVKLKKYTTNFHSFIYISIGFYSELLASILQRFNYEPKNRNLNDIVFLTSLRYREFKKVPDDFIARALEVNFIQRMCYRLLIRLGDLARYSQIYSSTNKNWGHPILLYKTALNIDPHNGNAYNQLGLLEAYLGSQMGAVSYAVKGLLIRSPFKTSANNLKSLFVRIYNYYRVSQENPSSVKTTHPITNIKKAFEKSFLELMSISVFAHPAKKTNILLELTEKTINEFISLCESQQFELTDEYLFEVIIVPIGILTLNISRESVRANVITLKNESLNILFNIIVKLFLSLLTLSFREDISSPYRNTLLKMINLICHWLCLIEDDYFPQIFSAISSVKGPLRTFHSKFASQIKGPPPLDTIVLKEYVSYEMFHPFGILASNSVSKRGKNENLHSKKEISESEVRIYSIYVKLEHFLKMPPPSSAMLKKLERKKKILAPGNLSPPLLGLSNGNVGSTNKYKNEYGNKSKPLSNSPRSFVKSKTRSLLSRNNSFENSDFHYRENSYENPSIDINSIHRENFARYDLSESHDHLNKYENSSSRDHFEFQDFYNDHAHNSVPYNIPSSFDNPLSRNNSMKNLYAHDDQKNVQKTPIPSMHTVSSITSMNISHQNPSFAMLLNSYGSINKSDILKKQLSYLYYGEASNVDEPDIRSHDAVASQAAYFDEENLSSDTTSEQISCDPVNTISFLGLENNQEMPLYEKSENNTISSEEEDHNKEFLDYTGSKASYE